MNTATILLIASVEGEPYGNVIITIIAISYIFKLLIEFIKNNDKK